MTVWRRWADWSISWTSTWTTFWYSIHRPIRWSTRWGNAAATEIGRLEIYDASGTLLDAYLTQALAGGQVETMMLSRAVADIAFALAFTEPGLSNFGRLDNLAFGTGEPSTITNADGEYWFTDLLPGDYVVREVVPNGFLQTAPRQTTGRLFATNVITNPDEIVELDPETGATLNRFAAPTNPGTSGLGLAFDGVTLFFVDVVSRSQEHRSGD